jgi:hypothetical protein
MSYNTDYDENMLEELNEEYDMYMGKKEDSDDEYPDYEDSDW